MTASTIPLRAALYLRVSTARQAEHDVSIPDQKRQGEAYCEARGLQLVETFIEPGASATMPVLRHLNASVHAQRCQVVQYALCPPCDTPAQSRHLCPLQRELYPVEAAANLLQHLMPRRGYPETQAQIMCALRCHLPAEDTGQAVLFAVMQWQSSIRRRKDQAQSAPPSHPRTLRCDVRTTRYRPGTIKPPRA